MHIGPTQPGWATRLVTLDDGATLVVRPSAVACATCALTSHDEKRDGETFLCCRGPGAVALEAPGGVLELGKNRIDVDERRLLGWSSTPRFKVVEYARTKWRSFSRCKVYAAAGIFDGRSKHGKATSNYIRIRQGHPVAIGTKVGNGIFVEMDL